MLVPGTFEDRDGYVGLGIDGRRPIETRFVHNHRVQALHRDRGTKMIIRRGRRLRVDLAPDFPGEIRLAGYLRHDREFQEQAHTIGVTRIA